LRDFRRRQSVFGCALSVSLLVSLPDGEVLRDFESDCDSEAVALDFAMSVTAAQRPD
jgi:hypothetical protein